MNASKQATDCKAKFNDLITNQAILRVGYREIFLQVCFALRPPRDAVNVYRRKKRCAYADIVEAYIVNT